jgi:hypothetical protein
VAVLNWVSNGGGRGSGEVDGVDGIDVISVVR